MSGNLKERLKMRWEKRDKGSYNRIQALDFGKREVTFWKPKIGINIISIIPYVIKSKNHPLVVSGDAKIGEEDFVLDLFIHRYVGPNNADIICPKRNFGKPCPICEQEKIYRDNGKEDEASDCRASQRAFYNIVDETNREKGLMVFEASYDKFQDELMNDAGEEGEIVDFVSFKHGKAIKFRAEEETFKKGKFFSYHSFRFPERKDSLDPDLLKDVISFDECMVLHSYDEIKAIFYGEDSEEKDDEEIEIHSSKDDDEDLDEENSGKKTKDEEESPRVKDKSSKCPYGFEFGKDCEKHEECDDCEVWTACYAAKKAMGKDKK